LPKKVIIIDNYDSFTFNLYQVVAKLGAKVSVFRNDTVTLIDLKGEGPSHIVISPGPKGPSETGISNDCIAFFCGRIPILGVCLGHQCIAHTFGGNVVKARRLMHGKTSLVFHDGNTIFKGIPSPFVAGRYHSLIVQKKELPKVLEVSACSEHGEIMAIRHREFQIEGVQFHPESFLTTLGEKILANFLRM
jgi:anthranilate synthase/aminodeoxychorismate synthase-like glutamine amidotransferase